MNHVFVRHTADCKYIDDPYYKRCKCKKWIYQDGGGRISAKTRSWDEAENRMREMEAGASKAEARREDTRTTIAEAVDLYLQKGLDEGNKSDTYEKKVRIFKGLSSEDPSRPKSHAKKIEERKKANGKYSPSLLHWAEKHGYKYITDIGLKQLMAWRSTWVGAAITRAKRQEKVCGFFHLCKNLGWITVSPAASLGTIKVEQTATGYFPADEYAHFFEVIDSWPGGKWSERDRIRLKVLTWLMRWSGLAIGDACTLRRDRLGDDDSIFLYRGKTGEPVRVILPPEIAKALREVPPGKNANPAYFFWSGVGNKKSAVADWQRVYRRVFKRAGMFTDRLTGEPKRAHPHMFRDTFAIEMLTSGADIVEVQMLLGHKNVKTTQNSYMPWVKKRQTLLNAAVRNSWQKSDLSVFGTRDRQSPGISV